MNQETEPRRQAPTASIAPMRVLHVCARHPALVRGAPQQACYDLFKALNDRGGDSLLLAATEPGQMPALFKSGATITGFDGRDKEFLFLAQGYDSLWHRNRHPASLTAFEAFLASVQPAVIHFHDFRGFGLEYLAVARNCLKGAGGKLVLTLYDFAALCTADGEMVRTFEDELCGAESSVRCHQCFPEHPPEVFSMRRMWIRRHLDLADWVVTPTQFLRQRYVDWGLKAERLVCIPTGYSGPAPSLPQIADERRNRFIVFAGPGDGAGLAVLSEALAILRQRDAGLFTLDIYGVGELPAAGSPARFHTAVEPAALPAIMADTDWLIVPSSGWDPAGLSVTQAFAFGRPVIAAAAGGAGERVRHDIDGLHVMARSARSLADAMQRAMAEPQLWARLHANIQPPPRMHEIAARHIRDCYAATAAA